MEITDKMLFEHAPRARDIWLGTLLADEDIPEFQTSKAFEKKMKKLIKEQRRDPRTNKMLKIMRRTVAAVLVVATISFGGLMSVEAYREKVIEIVVHVFQELTEYRFVSERAEISDIVLPDVSFGYIPDGLQEVKNRISINNCRYIIYEDNAGRFFEFTQRAVGTNGKYGAILDTEDSVYDTVFINGDTAFYNVKGDNVSVFWTRNNVIYDIYGNFDLEEIIEIVKNMGIFEK